MDSQEISTVSEAVNQIMAKSIAIKTQCELYPKAIKALHSEPQELLNTHNECPDIFYKNREVIDSTLAFMKLSKILILNTESFYLLDLEILNFTIETVRAHASLLGESPEFQFFDKNIQDKLAATQHNLDEAIKIKLQLRSYIEYQNRTLEYIMKK